MTLPKLPKLPEPAIGPSYSAYQMQIYAERVMEETIEAAAKVCEAMWGDGGDANDFAQAIRSINHG